LASFPLQDVRVLDLTRLLPGGFCSLILADLGADVIKIEDRRLGDYGRWWDPKVGDCNVGFQALNRNKRSVCLNLKRSAGPLVFLRMVETADVVMESFRPGTMKRLNIDYERLRERNPGLIYCAISGYGQRGPHAGLAGHDLNFLAESGALAAAGPPGTTPATPSIQAADIGAGFAAANAILAALYRRERTGQGAFIDACLLDAALSFSFLHRALAFALHRPLQPGGEELTGGLACYHVYATADGRAMALGALEAKFFRAFLTLVGREELAADQFVPEQQPALKRELAGIFAGKTQVEWATLLADHGADVCCTPVQDALAADANAQIAARQLLFHADGVAHTRSPVRLAGTPPPAYRAPPAFGADTAAVLREIGLDDSEIETLFAEKVAGPGRSRLSTGH